MTEVYLAERESDCLPVVLKVLDASGKATSAHLSRFIQEYTLLSQIEHPHVIRIHDQGFTDDHAYIAMEYFEQGDLRAELTAGMSRQRVLEVIAQVTAGAGGHPCARHHPPRPQAREHHAARRQHRGAGRLRHRQVGARIAQPGADADPARRRGGHALLPQPRAGGRPADHAAVGPVQPGRDDVRDAGRAPAVPRRLAGRAAGPPPDGAHARRCRRPAPRCSRWSTA